MPKMKKKLTGISEYFHDLFHSMLYKELYGKLNGHGNTYKHSDSHRSVTNYDDLYLIKTFPKNSSSKVLIVSISKLLDDGRYKDVKYSIELTHNVIVYYPNRDDKSTYEQIKCQSDLFNIQMQCNISISYSDLLLIQKLFVKVVKKRNINNIMLCYTPGEEKQYGY